MPFRPVAHQGTQKPQTSQFRAVRGQGVRRQPQPVVEPDRSKHCVGNDNTCGGFKVKGEELCAGHLRQRNAMLSSEEVADDPSGTA